MTRGTRIHDSRIWSRAAMAAFVLAPAGAAPAHSQAHSPAHSHSHVLPAGSHGASLAEAAHKVAAAPGKSGGHGHESAPGNGHGHGHAEDAGHGHGHAAAHGHGHGESHGHGRGHAEASGAEAERAHSPSRPPV